MHFWSVWLAACDVRIKRDCVRRMYVGIKLRPPGYCSLVTKLIISCSANITLLCFHYFWQYHPNFALFPILLIWNRFLKIFSYSFIWHEWFINSFSNWVGKWFTLAPGGKNNKWFDYGYPRALCTYLLNERDMSGSVYLISIFDQFDQAWPSFMSC